VSLQSNSELPSQEVPGLLAKARTGKVPGSREAVTTLGRGALAPPSRKRRVALTGHSASTCQA
jgi:hypothetical protein